MDIEGIAPRDVAGFILKPEDACLIISIIGGLTPTEAEVVPRRVRPVPMQIAEW